MTMRVLRYSAPRHAEIVESRRPRASGRVSVAKTVASQVSAGTEMAFYRGEAPQLNHRPDEHGLWQPLPNAVTYPMQADDPGVWWMGYAAVGRIVEVAPEEKELREGDLVFLGAGHMGYLASDAFLKLPTDTDPDQAALLALMGVAMNGVWDARVGLLDEVVVIGMGTVGQLLLQMCRLSGARVTAVDRLPARLALAKQMGAEHVFNPATDGDLGEFVFTHTEGRGADAVIEASGNVHALPDAIRCAGIDGQVTVVSFYPSPADTLHLGREFHHKRTIIRSSQSIAVNPALGRGYNSKRRRGNTVKLLRLLNLKPLITHRVPFESLPGALEMIDNNPADCLSVVVHYG